MSQLAVEALEGRVRAAFPSVEARAAENGWPYLLVPGEQIAGVARFLRTEKDLAFDALMDLAGCDLLNYPRTPPSNAIAVVYQLYSYRHRHRLTCRVEVPRETCVVPTVSGEWPAAIYFEREVWDLFGVRFAGHPSLHRILCPEDWQGHPLRKDYLYPAAYHGVAHAREGQHFEGAPAREGDRASEGDGARAGETAREGAAT